MILNCLVIEKLNHSKTSVVGWPRIHSGLGTYLIVSLGYYYFYYRTMYIIWRSSSRFPHNGKYACSTPNLTRRAAWVPPCVCVLASLPMHRTPKSPQDLLSPGRPLNKGIRNDTGGRPSSTVRLCRIPEVSHKP